MKILAIETSCDETAIAILEAEGDEKAARFRVLGSALLSQVEVHKEYGGVFPALAKREHAKNLVPLLAAALEEAELLHEDTQEMPEEMRAKIAAILAREPGLGEQFFAFVSEAEPPEVDTIAVTAGPGLEPALWVGVNFAKALALAWGKPLVAVNHMEGHLLAALAKQRADGSLQLADISLPVLALLISGGHTELVLMKEWLEYELIGQTRDDAVGEAFDKVARMLGLPYPGGPQISRLAESLRTSDTQLNVGPPRSYIQLPRPMIDSGDCDFSFAGLKTAVLYLLKNRSYAPQPNEHTSASNAPESARTGAVTKIVRPEYFCDSSEEMKKHIACEFENAVADVLSKKTSRALEDSGARTLVIGGGVSANTHIRRVFEEKIAQAHPRVTLRLPATTLTTDNAVMIAMAGFYRAQKKEFADPTTLSASGNRSLA